MTIKLVVKKEKQDDLEHRKSTDGVPSAEKDEVEWIMEEDVELEEQENKDLDSDDDYDEDYTDEEDEVVKPSGRKRARQTSGSGLGLGNEGAARTDDMAALLRKAHKNCIIPEDVLQARLPRNVVNLINARHKQHGASIDILEDSGGGMLTSAFCTHTEGNVKDNLHDRPVWVTKNKRIFLETHNKLYQQAYEFIISIAEPINRPTFIHEYEITELSLYTAVTVGLSGEQILDQLESYSKVKVPSCVEEFIRCWAQDMGKLNIVLKEQIHHLEIFDEEKAAVIAADRELMQCLVKRESIQAAVLNIVIEFGLNSADPEYEAVIESLWQGQKDVWSVLTGLVCRAGKKKIKEIELQTERMLMDQGALNVDRTAVLKNLTAASLFLQAVELMEGHTETSAQIVWITVTSRADGADPKNLDGGDAAAGLFVDELDVDDAHGDGISHRKLTACYAIPKCHIMSVRKRLSAIKCPFLDEYDYSQDSSTGIVRMPLKAAKDLRPYQVQSLSRIFYRGRARSGIIVLPCGAGKTLLGVAAASNIHRRTLIFCNCKLAARQWSTQFQHWTEIDENEISMFLSGNFQYLGKVVITTYHIMTESQKRSPAARKLQNEIRKATWGLVIFDEVHMLPSKTFANSIKELNAHCKLGLTATLVREDQRINNLQWLVGPKLYEANWMDLAGNGFLANVQCVQVNCPMTPGFMNAYLQAVERKDFKDQEVLWQLNPMKLPVLKYLLNKHIALGDKILVFCDDLIGLKSFAEDCNYGHKAMDGSTSDSKRDMLLREFRAQEGFAVLFLSKVGDVAIDLPDANVLIQVCSQYGSRRQEAQRFGRILRAKPNPEGSFNAHFYTLCTSDTQEAYFGPKRQDLLVSQGYSYEVIDLARFDENLLDEWGVIPSFMRQKELEYLVKAGVDTQNRHGLNLQGAAGKLSSSKLLSKRENGGKKARGRSGKSKIKIDSSSDSEGAAMDGDDDAWEP